LISAPHIPLAPVRVRHVFNIANNIPVAQQEIPDEIDLLEAVAETLNGVSDAELQHVFRSWIELAERVIDAGEDYLIW
jgi:hypothetical protein